MTAPVLFAAGVLAAAGRPCRATSARPLAAVAAVALGARRLVSLVTPWLAERSVRDVNGALDRGDVERLRTGRAARALARPALDRAASLARGCEEAGRDPRGRAGRVRARPCALQPKNPETWYALGLYEFDRGDLCRAYVHLNEAYTLDPAGRQWTTGGPLDQAACPWVNDGEC